MLVVVAGRVEYDFEGLRPDAELQADRLVDDVEDALLDQWANVLGSGLEAHDVLGHAVHAEAECLLISGDVLIEITDCLEDLLCFVGRSGLETEVADEQLYLFRDIHR